MTAQTNIAGKIMAYLNLDDTQGVKVLTECYGLSATDIKEHFYVADISAFKRLAVKGIPIVSAVTLLNELSSHPAVLACIFVPDLEDRTGHFYVNHTGSSDLAREMLEHVLADKTIHSKHPPVDVTDQTMPEFEFASTPGDDKAIARLFALRACDAFIYGNKPYFRTETSALAVIGGLPMAGRGKKIEHFVVPFLSTEDVTALKHVQSQEWTGGPLEKDAQPQDGKLSVYVNYRLRPLTTPYSGDTKNNNPSVKKQYSLLISTRTQDDTQEIELSEELNGILRDHIPGRITSLVKYNPSTFADVLAFNKNISYFTVMSEMANGAQPLTEPVQYLNPLMLNRLLGNSGVRAIIVVEVCGDCTYIHYMGDALKAQKLFMLHLCATGNTSTKMTSRRYDVDEALENALLNADCFFKDGLMYEIIGSTSKSLIGVGLGEPVKGGDLNTIEIPVESTEDLKRLMLYKADRVLHIGSVPPQEWLNNGCTVVHEFDVLHR